MTGREMAGREMAVEVHVRIPAALRDLAGGGAEIIVALGDETRPTVGRVLDALARTHPPLERRIRDEQGNIRRHVNLFLGTDNVRDRDGAASEIAAGEVLVVVPAVSGG